VGPLFSLVIAGVGLLALLACVFVVLRFRHASVPALGRAMLWVGGFVVGLAGAGGTAVLVLGAGAALHSSVGVIGYLGWLSLGGLAGGCAASRLAARFRE
jgi:hypothetical protein